MYRYIAVKEKLYHKDIGTYTSYGIKAFKDGKEVGFVSDVSVDRDFVEELVELCNTEQLDPIHLFDVVEDAIS